MLDGVRAYIINISAAAIISFFAVGITERFTTYGKTVKLLTGLFLTLTVLSPIVSLKPNAILDYFDDLSVSAEDVIAKGEAQADLFASDIISERVASYIQETGTSMGVDIQAEVTLDPATQMPMEVSIFGQVNPFTKERLCNFIETNLGVQKENQHWQPHKS